MAETGDFRVLLVAASTEEARHIDVAYWYRGELPAVDQEIEVVNELKPDDRRRARVTRIESEGHLLGEGPVIHAVELGA